MNERFSFDLILLSPIFWVISIGLLGISYLNYTKYGSDFGFYYFPPIALLFIFRYGSNFIAGFRQNGVFCIELLSWTYFASINLLIYQLLSIYPPEVCLKNAPFFLAVSATLIITATSSIHLIGVKVLIVMTLQIVLVYFTSSAILYDYGSQIYIGGLLGTFITLGFYLTRAFQCYLELSSTESIVHAYEQLKKMVLPHQTEMIRAGYNLEETMPIGQEEAGVICFDIQQSSILPTDVLTNLMKKLESKLSKILLYSYTTNPLAGSGFMINAMGDGFICSVGFPLASTETEGKNLYDATLKTAFQFLEAFNDIASQVDSKKPIRCSIGVSFGEIKSYYSHFFNSRYELYGAGIVKATRYQEFRKKLKPVLGVDANYVIVDSEIVNEENQEIFCLELFDLTSHQLTIRNDSTKTVVYFHLDKTQQLQKKKTA